MPDTDAYLLFTSTDIKIPYNDEFIDSIPIDLTTFDIATTT